MFELKDFEELTEIEALYIDGGSYVLVTVLGEIKIIYDQIVDLARQIPIIGPIFSPLQSLGDTVFNVVNDLAFQAITAFTTRFPSTSTWPL